MSGVKTKSEIYKKTEDSKRAFYKIAYVITSMRPKQWIKNGFVFAGLIFSKSFFKPESIFRSICAFMLFSLVSGSVYIINDIIDRKRDALHPKKRFRPIASGNLQTHEAMVCALITLTISLVVAFLLDILFSIILVLYFVQAVVYSISLKNVVIIDVILIATGFVLRTAGGAVVLHVRISPWLIVCTTLLALFLALNKRKNELLVLSKNAGSHRKILKEYTPELIDQMLSVVTPTTLISYALYTFNAEKSYCMMLTIPFVLYGIFRYQYLASTRDMGGSPELALLNDKPLLINIVLWVIASIVIVASD
ncbi:MAG TPA: decaprenyl-phosphate phosphoribosyltransferase [Clostridiaceae bacterium]|nr:decaprenyl-phosphate phosphoribosyltransferase [Clostridiaceae bacterium]